MGKFLGRLEKDYLKDDNFIEDYQKVLKLQELSHWLVFEALDEFIERFFPIGEWLYRPEDNYDVCDFREWAITASTEELKKALFSKEWRKDDQEHHAG